MGVLSMCCAVLVSTVSCASGVVKFSRIHVVVIRVLFAVRRFVRPFWMFVVSRFPLPNMDHE